MPEHQWQKSSFSGGATSGECVEVTADIDGRIRLRESEAPGTALATSRPAWSAFLRTVKAES
ncbi:DUF397 domain-containing protein [Streptomyces sp. NPDC050610]|uniref:DUF397 domain-containing protein n=1 Tax=Streptomyces sp. NPDC050610 TaxID=3157097 RepID=UPI00342CD253